jgi:hypothetical protein
MANSVVSTSLDPEKIAKARDGLITLGYDQKHLGSISAIIRTTFLYGLLYMEKQLIFKDSPSAESMSIVNRGKIGKKG